MSLKVNAGRLAGCNIPEPRCTVVAGCKQLTTIRREVDRVNVSSVTTIELANSTSGRRIPNLCRVIPTAGRNQLAVRRDVRGCYRSMRAEADDWPASFDGPQRGVV